MNWYDDPQWWLVIIAVIQVIASIIIGFIAIFGERIRNFLFKPKYQFDVLQTEQKISGETRDYKRIKISNMGRRKAKNVKLFLEEILDIKDGTIVVRENFIPMPLAWTHGDYSSRNIVANESAFIDLGSYNMFDEADGFAINTVSRDDARLYLVEDTSVLKVRLIEENGDSGNVDIFVKVDFSSITVKIL